MKMLSTRMKMMLLMSSLFLLYAVGCSDSDGGNAMYAQPTDEDREDIAEDFGTALAGEEEGMLGMWHDGGTTLTDRTGTRALDDTLTVEHGGFTMVRIRDFYDVNDIWSEFYIPGVTARMVQTLTVEGTRESVSGNRSVTVSHADTLDITGLLLTDEIKYINGNGDRNVEGEFRSRFRQNVRTFESHYDWTVTDLQIHNDREEHPYPLDGTISVQGVWINTHTNPGRDFEQSVLFSFEIHFDGTRYAELVFENGATFWIDLDNGWCWHDRPGGMG